MPLSTDRPLRRLARHVLLAATLLYTAVGAAWAAPFNVYHWGEVTQPVAPSSLIPGIYAGDRYSVAFVVDNGGATAQSQTWTGEHLRCAIWTVERLDPSGENYITVMEFQQDLTATPPTTVNGTLTTGPGGALTGMFNQIAAVPAGSYSATGVTLTPPVEWFANGINDVFYDSGSTRSFGSALGGVPMGPSNLAAWSGPNPYDGECGAPAGYTVSVDVIGLNAAGGAVDLTLSGAQSGTTSMALPPGATYPMAFPVQVNPGTGYAVALTSQPTGQSCAVEGGNASGIMPAANVTVTLRCQGGGLPPSGVTAVPTLGVWSLLALGLVAGGLGARRLRARADGPA